jgi:putative tricarboxylic transport membrane protein
MAGIFSKLLFINTFFVITALAATAAAADWRPDRPVELIAGAAAGGSQDVVMRVVQQIAQNRKLIEVPVNVVNKPGAGGVLAAHYLMQHAGDARYALIMSPTLLTGHIMGKSNVHHNDLTPLAVLFTEPIGFTVRADSAIKDGRDLVARLRKDPTSMSIAVGTALGNANHIALAQVLKAAGMPAADIRRLKLLAFKAGSEAMTALIGGHIDALVLTPTGIGQHIQAGRLRMVAAAAPKRLAGDFAGVPTWKELGLNVEGESGRVMIGPRGLTAPQVAFWENAFERIVATDEWRRELEKNAWDTDFRKSAAARRYLDERYDELKAILIDLGMAK